MDERISESVTGQDEPKPSRGERDAAFSSGAGRKAVEVPLEEQERESRVNESEAPVGLELETRAQRTDLEE